MNNIHNISPIELQKILEANKALLIDVREKFEFQAEAIRSAINIPLSAFKVNKANIPNHENKKLVFHCKLGGRSLLVCQKLQKDNIGCDIWNLEGGIVAWKNAGLPIKISSKLCLPIEKQVQITIGTLTSLGVILGYFLSHGWLILPLIMGIGLINAGISGNCTMAKIMAKMPWNNK